MKRGQIEFGESLMVVIVLVFLLIIGIVFYFSATKGSLQREQQYREEIESVKLAKAVLGLPEVRCGSYDATGTCIDNLKLAALSRMLNASDKEFDDPAWAYYGRLFGYATIKVNVPPVGGPAEEYVLYHDKPDTETTSTGQFIFTTLYDPVTETQRLAYLNVTRYTVVQR
jgi:hypothetical protein